MNLSVYLGTVKPDISGTPRLYIDGKPERKPVVVVHEKLPRDWQHRATIEKYRKLFGNRTLTAPQVAQELGESPTQVHKRMTRLAYEGHIVASGKVKGSKAVLWKWNS